MPTYKTLHFARSFFLIFLLAVLPPSIAQAQTGTLTDPFTHTSHAHDAPSTGRYYFDLGNGLFQADVITEHTGGWILVGQYRHKGGTNPALSVIGAGSDFPVNQAVSLGIDGSLSATEWGHAGNAAMSQFGGDIETRFYGQTANHSRIVHFSTPLGSDYIKTGTGSFAGINSSSNHTLLTGHTANLPASTTHTESNFGDNALTVHPFYQWATSHWNLRTHGDRWEVDGWADNDTYNTHHQIYARTEALDYGGSSASCAFETDFDGNLPGYDSTPYYALNNTATLNGQHVSSTPAISSDASGSGKFLFHNTSGPLSPFGEAWGSATAITVTPNTYYKFTYYMASENGTRKAIIQPQINGVDVGGTHTTTTVGSWEEVTVIWNSAAATTADLSLQQQRGTGAGIDWGFDDISLCEEGVDRSDAPTSGTSYGEAAHQVDGSIKLGAAIDTDASVIANTNADGDGVDDDGVTIPALYPSSSSTITVAVNQAAASDGYLQGWIDWNGDGDFADAGEQVATNLQYSAGTSGNISVAVTPPATATTTQTFARFRWSTTSGLNSTTLATDGEVEDYAVTITAVTDGISTASCPYVHTMDSSAPLYTSLPYYALNNTATLNGQHVSSTPAISSDASGSGKFLFHNTSGPLSPFGEAWGSATAITVTPNTYYKFTYYMASENGTRKAIIQPQINGVDVGGTHTTTTVGSWEEVTVIWNSAAATTADLSLQQQRGTGAGIDWGFDDISLCEEGVDRSDAPTSGTSYGEAAHQVDGSIKLGAAIDTDASVIANTNADGDGVDDDGVTIPALYPSSSSTITVAVNQAAASDGYLQGWIDWNGDGDFADAGEQVATNLQYSAGTSGNISVAVTPPATATTTQTFARFRWSTTSGLNSTTLATDGEVEDYAVTITAVTDGISTASCPYVHTMDSSAPLYTSLPYYALNNTATLNGQHVSSTPAISSDASGSGKFLFHNTSGPLSPFGEAWGSATAITVTPNTYYKFTYYMASENGTRKAIIQPQINGVDVGGTHTTTTVGSWEEVTVIWNSAAATTADLSLQQQRGTGAGIDWGFDDISLCEEGVDRSDAPTSGTSYGEAAHQVDGSIKLGAAIDTDASVIANTNADGDGVDDDGVTIPALYPSSSSTITVAVNQAAASDGYLQGWIDWNGDGDFADAGEQVATNLQYSAGTSGNISVAVTPPATATTTQTFARFRWSTTSGLNSTTLATDGEVEDYAVTITAVTDGISTASCPYVHTMDSSAPLYTSLPYYALNNTATLNGQHVSSTPAISSDASGSGKFLFHNTSGPLSPFGEAWGSATAITVTPNTYYKFTYYMASENGTRKAIIQPQINGVDVGGTHTTTTVGSWEEVTVIWNSAAATTADLSLQQQRGTGAGIDWGFDDISLCEEGVDRSDAPTSGTSYGEAAHQVDGSIKLGAAIDTDASVIANTNADGDGVDDDGVTIPALYPSSSSTITVAVNQAAASDGYLQGWIDWNGDGDFADAGEQVATNLQYSAGTSGNISVAVTPPATATTTQTFARFRWSTTSGLNSTTLATDGEVEDYAFSILAGSTTLDATKSISVWDPSAIGLYALPGNDIISTLKVVNTGNAAVDADSLFLIEQIPNQVKFFNGDIDDGGPEGNPASFEQVNNTTLTLTYASDVGYSNGTTRPANFAACNYVPSAGYDPNVTYICFNPKGILKSGNPNPEFSVSFRGQIK